MENHHKIVVHTNADGTSRPLTPEDYVVGRAWANAHHDLRDLIDAEIAKIYDSAIAAGHDQDAVHAACRDAQMRGYLEAKRRMAAAITQRAVPRSVWRSKFRDAQRHEVLDREKARNAANAELYKQQKTTAPAFVPPNVASPRRCRTDGHDWRHMGGANAGCRCGSCSVPVHECLRCGDCDYGDNEEADEIRTECKETCFV